MPGVLYNETQAGLNMHVGLCSRPFLSYNTGAQWQICEPHSATGPSPGRALEGLTVDYCRRHTLARETDGTN